MMRLLFLVISLMFSGLSLLSVLEYWRYEEVPQNVALLLKSSVNARQLEQAIEHAIQADDPVTARRYLKLAQTFDYDIEAAVYWPRIHALEAYFPATRRQIEQFANGFLEGQGSTGAAVAGSVIADFTVIGDVRDLQEQYAFYQQGDTVNQLIVILAGTGLALTAATIASGGSAGVARPGVSTLKLAVRRGHLKPSFQRYLLRQVRPVFDYEHFWKSVKANNDVRQWKKAAVRAYDPQALSRLRGTLDQINDIRRSTSLADTVQVLRYVENGQDLTRLQNISRQYDELAPALLRLLGRTALGSLRILRYSIELLVSLLLFAFFLFLKVFLFYRYLRIN